MADLHGFEVFQRPDPGVRSSGPRVSLRARGLLALNPAAYAALGSPEFAELLWSADRRAIGIRATGPRPHAYKIGSAYDGREFHLSVRGFCKYYGVTATGRFTPVLEDRMLIIELRDREADAGGGSCGTESPS